MSKTIIIERGGTAETWEDLSKILTKAVDGQSIYWLFIDETRVMPLAVNLNGSYSADNKGLYGFNLISVSVPGNSITGIGDDGKTYTATVDLDGNIVMTEVE